MDVLILKECKIHCLMEKGEEQCIMCMISRRVSKKLTLLTVCLRKPGDWGRKDTTFSLAQPFVIFEFLKTKVNI